MKILLLADDFLPDSDVRGGAGIIAFRLAHNFRAQGHEVHVLTASAHAEKCGTFDVNGISVRCFHSFYNHDRWRSYRSLYNPGVVREVARAVRDIQPDIVHAHTVHLYLSYASLLTARRYCSRVFLTAHDVMPFYPGTFTEFIDRDDLSCPNVFNYRVTAGMMLRRFGRRYNPLRNFFIRQVLKRLTGVVAVSGALRDALTQNNIPVHSVIHNGIDVQSRAVAAADVAAFTEKYGVSGLPIILWGGRLSGAKGGGVILQALELVVRAHPAAMLMVMGEKGEYTTRMEQEAAQRGLSAHVVFTDWLNESESTKAYAAATVVAVPSVCFDSFPTNNLEGFAAHKPVVATCFGGSREVVHDGENGRIVNPFDVSAFAAAMSDLLSDAEKARRWGEAGYATVTTEFTLEKMTREYVELFASSAA